MERSPAFADPVEFRVGWAAHRVGRTPKVAGPVAAAAS